MEVTVTVRPLAELEATIERGLTTFVEVGQALLEIREHRLYRETHDSFAAYCRERWGWSKTHANRQIEAARVASDLTPIGVSPSNEAQARELARLKDAPEAIREVWTEVQEERGEAVTAADVRQAVDRRLGIERQQPIRHAPDPDISDDYIEDINQDTEDVPPGYTPEAWAYEQATATPEPEPTIGALLPESFSVPPAGLDPHRKAWHAAVAPAMYRRLDPARVIATREPQEIERGLEMMAETVAYVTALIEAGRQVLGRSRLEVVQ